jgi:hypothetical protein
VALALAACVSFAHLWAGRVPRLDPGRSGALALVVACVLVYGAVGVRYTSQMTASGDEPHYLLMAQSLWREGDLDLRDNVERGDYRAYFPGTLSPHWGAPRADGRPFPAHSPGLPLLLAPAYALGGRAACVALFALLGAALVHEVWLLALRVTEDARSALVAALAAAGPPVFYYAFHLYTELPSALAVGLSLRILTGAPGPVAAALAALSISSLPWLHLKMIPAAAALGLVALARLRGRSLAAFVAVASPAVVAFAGYYLWIFGSPTPLAVYGGGVPPDSVVSPLRAAAGLLLDRSFGLIPHAPVFLLSVAGLPLLFSKGLRREAWPHLLVGAAVLAPLLSWRMWWGGQCPPARLLVPLVPLLGVAIAALARGTQRGLARWRWALLAIGTALALFMAVQPGERLMLNRGSRPTRVWAALSGETPVERYLPSLVLNAGPEQRVAMLWAGAIVLLLGLHALARRRAHVDEALFRGLGLPLVLLLAVGILVDRWARTDDQARSRGMSESSIETSVTRTPR